MSYKDRKLDTVFRADFLCFDEIILEFKVLKFLTDVETAQVINELKASGKKRALLINFGAKRLEFKRIVLDWEPEFPAKPSARSA